VIFANRQQAGKKLADKLKPLNFQNPIILALPRGGVPVGLQIAKALSCPLDIITVKKISSPFNPELALGAAAPDNIVFWEKQTSGHYDDNSLKTFAQTAQRQRQKKDKLLRGEKPYPDLNDKTVILVDDGLATGSTALAAISWLKTQNPAKIILAVPVAPPDTLEKVKPLVDNIICLHIDSNFWAVGQFYQDFTQTTDQEVINILKKTQK